MSADVVARIRAYIVDTFLFGDAEADLPTDASLMDFGVVDSTGVLDLVVFVEDEFGIQVADDELTPANFDTIDRLAAYIQSKREAMTPPQIVSGDS